MCYPLEKCVVLCSQKWPFPSALRAAFNVLTIKEMFVLVMCYIKYSLDIIKGDYSSLCFFFFFPSLPFSLYVGGNVTELEWDILEKDQGAQGIVASL